ncbi:MAG TPA: NADH-quinone oxidoreductase subunit NuoE [Syntrophobacteraceae bacterium]|nr:NADH-quinone oxidoreductase subunit NuoE [Syntrophobacteraceae bacterium]
MVPSRLRDELRESVVRAEHPREKAVDVMFALQDHYGYMNDRAMAEAAEILGMTPLELEELATFYDFIYREPVGKYVIRVCDSAVCWMNGLESVLDHLQSRLGISTGETTPDGLFTLLPVCCIGYCDRSPAMLVNRKVYGNLTGERIDEILEDLRRQAALSQRND